MMRKINFILILGLLFDVWGCSQVTEVSKVIWGSSTRALEAARVDAISKTYQCSLDDCFDAVLSLARSAKSAEAIEEATDEEEGEFVKKENVNVADDGVFNVFINNRRKRHIVVMGIAGNVDTTEVGMFFSQPNQTTVKLDVTSLSASAKRKVAQEVFDALDLRFSAM